MPTPINFIFHRTARLGSTLSLRVALSVAVSVLLSGPLGAASATAAVLRSPLTAQPAPATIPSLSRTEIKLPTKDSGILFAAPSITVKQIEVKPNEFPVVTAAQYKVGFECTIRVMPAQKDYSKYPRHTCFIDQPRTAALNGLTIVRVDSWPSADGVTSKIVMIADKNSAKNPNPGRIRTAFQLLHETTDKVSKPVLKDFVYADGLLK